MNESYRVAGVDEAGRGCLAGPVVAAAVILPKTWDLPGMTDSKQLSAKRREILAGAIKEQALYWALGVVWPPVIDTINILQSTKRAMLTAIERLGHIPDMVYIDGNQPVPTSLPQKSIVGGDSSEPSIAAASIVAKTFRDRVMVSLERRYPGYGFARHKGYGTRAHLEALRRLGPSRMHRLTFKGVVQREEHLCLPGI
jgi:ribonuclease HII